MVITVHVCFENLWCNRIDVECSSEHRGRRRTGTIDWFHFEMPNYGSESERKSISKSPHVTIEHGRIRNKDVATIKFNHCITISKCINCVHAFKANLNSDLDGRACFQIVVSWFKFSIE